MDKKHYKFINLLCWNWL